MAAQLDSDREVLHVIKGATVSGGSDYNFRSDKLN